jgi:sec-independent protein translocase protein TatB
MFPEGRILDFVIVGIVALIVVGPKDLPILMRKLGQFIAHMRSMAAEFRASFDELARQSELDELRREVDALRTGQSLHAAVGLGADSGIQDVLNEIHTGLASGAIPAQAPIGGSEPASEADPATQDEASVAPHLPAVEPATPPAPADESATPVQAAK